MLALALVLVLGQADAGMPLDAPQASKGFTLFDDYKCPAAPPPLQVDGSWVLSQARMDRIDCGLAGAQAEIDAWRPSAAPKVAPSSGFSLQPSHGVIALVGALITTELAIIKDRSAAGCRGVANPFLNHCH
jgi:hypothetical protein